jgi:GT2 family glycosyltransferase
LSPNEPHPQHVVTAVIVAHDGAGWLAHGIDALLAQTKPVHRVVAVDTGSRDRSGSVLAAKLSQGAVFGMERSTGYAAAVRRALQHRAASTPPPAQAGGRGRGEQTEWIWLLHDDCEPAPDALEQLLRGAAETPNAAVLGPKLRDWTQRDVILEAGLCMDSVGRRITGIEPREVDQGQHDGDRDVLAVSSAGMLVRRDVWDQVGGFDPGMALFGEDIDFCWRVHAAGFRVRVITDSVVYHALAATRGRRAISVGRRARLLDRRNALLTLLGNLPAAPMLTSLFANLAISLVRTVFYLVAKRGKAALDETAAVLGVVGDPLRFAAARRLRARGRRAAYSRVRADLVPGRSVRRMAEFIALLLWRSSEPDAGARHSATDDPTDDDSLLVDKGFLQRFLTRPGVLLVLGLIIVSGVAEHRLISGGPLGGGALLPAWEGSSRLWNEVLAAFHPAGVGSASAAPPYAAFVALLATVLLGKVWLAIDVLLLGCVPLAGVTALLALRRVTKSAAIRVWAAGSYALLPVAFGAVAAGRLGSAVAFVLVPLLGLLAGRMFSETPRRARRAAWATGLVLTVGTAFVPVLWPLAVLGTLVSIAIVYKRGRAMLINLGIATLTPLVLLLPWMLEQLAHPSALLLEAGVQQPGLASTGLPARSLLLLSPGGPGLPPYWVSAALVLVGLVALLARRQRALVMSGWAAALLGYATAVAVSHVTVTPPGGVPITPWPGPALAIAAAGLLLAAAAGTDGLARSAPRRTRTGAQRGGSQRWAVVLLGVVAASAPLLAAAYWLVNGVSSPVGPVSSQVIPALVPVTGSAGRQLRTLVLTSDHGHLSYLLLRTESPQFADPGVVPVPAAQAALSRAVAALIAPSGGQAADQSQLLANFDIGFVLLRAPVSAALASQLDAVSGLTGVSMTSGFDLWKLTSTPSRVAVAEASGAVVPISSGPVGVSGAKAPAAGGILELAEPTGGWDASLNGQALQPVASPAGSWAQAFRLPAGGGTISIGRAGLIHDLVTALELLAFLVVAVLALPGVRTAAELEAEAVATTELDSDLETEQPEAQPSGAEPGSRPAVPVRAGRGLSAAGRRKMPTGRRGTGAVPETATAARSRARGRAAAAGGVAAAAAASNLEPDGLASGGAETARAAWPAGQPANRFLSGPPEPRTYRDDTGELARQRTQPGRPPAEPGRPADERPGYGRPMPGQADERPGYGRPMPGRPADERPGYGRPMPMPSRPADERPGYGGAAPMPSRPADDRPGYGRPAPMPARSPSGSRFDDGPGGPDGPPAPERNSPDPAWGESPRRPVPPPDDEPQPEPERRRRGRLAPRARADGQRGRRRHAAASADRDAGPSSGPQEQPRFPAPERQSVPPATAVRSPSGRPYDDRPDNDRPHGSRPGYRDDGWRLGDDGTGDRSPRPERGRDWSQPQQTSGWSGSDTTWRSDDYGSSWPERGRDPSWSPEYPAVPGQQGWNAEADALEALPAAEEVHHDWPRRERSGRGWIAPEDEQDGGRW